jgi:hypothetical protein
VITIDQGKIDAPHFPRDQEWWDGFVPFWITVTVRPDGTVALDANCRHAAELDGTSHRDPVTAGLTATVRRRRRAGMARWISECAGGRLAAGIVEPATAQHRDTAR